MLAEHVTNDYYARFHNPSYHRYRERHLSILRHKIMTKSVECEMKVNGTRSSCMLVEYVTNDYYARFHNPSNHR